MKVTGSYFNWFPRKNDGTMLVPNTFILGWRGVHGAGSTFRVIDSGVSQFVHVQAFQSGNQWGWQQGTSGAFFGLTSGGVNAGDGASHYYEVKIKIDPSNGFIVMHCDEVEVFNMTGLATQGGGTVLNVGGFYWPNYSTMSDIVLMDINGAVNNDFLGDVHVETKIPTGEGSHLDFTVPGGGTHYTNVDDLGGTDGDSTYVQSSAVAGQKESYTHEAMIDTTGSIYGVAVYGMAKGTDTGQRGMQALVRSGSSESLGPSQPVAYATYQQTVGGISGYPVGFSSLCRGVFETNPAGGAWTRAAVDACEIGIATA
jgi:hypothetical protein